MRNFQVCRPSSAKPCTLRYASVMRVLQTKPGFKLLNYQKVELPKRRNPFLTLIICNKLSNKESKLWLELKVILILTGSTCACTEAELAIAGFPPAVFLQVIWELHPHDPGRAFFLPCSCMICQLTTQKTAALGSQGTKVRQ